MNRPQKNQNLELNFNLHSSLRLYDILVPYPYTDPVNYQDGYKDNQHENCGLAVFKELDVVNYVKPNSACTHKTKNACLPNVIVKYVQNLAKQM